MDLKLWGIRVISLIAPIALGIGVVNVAQSDRAEPARGDVTEQALAVRVIIAEPVDARPRALAYGTVRAAESWRAVARVAGTVVDVHDGLKIGSVVDKGTVVFRIDDLDYRLAIADAEAALESAQADLAELVQSEANARALLDIEQRTLALAETDLERNRTLRDRGTIAQSTLDQSELDRNARLTGVRDLRNTIALIPAQTKVLEARIAQANADLALARLDLERTAVTAPFTGRVTADDISPGQFLAVGEAPVTIDGIQTAEIEAELPTQRLIPLLSGAEVTLPTAFSEAGVRSVFDEIGIEARVRYRAGDLTFVWDGRFAGTRGSLDPVTRTLGVVISVDAPYAKARPGVHPPLIGGMYVEVELIGASRPGLIAVPRGAVRDGAVLLADSDDRLRRVPVTVAYRQGDMVVLADGIAAGDRIVVGDPRVAIDGQLLSITEDAVLAAKLNARAAGDGAVR